jgi:hypothetical protein
MSHMAHTLPPSEFKAALREGKQQMGALEYTMKRVLFLGLLLTIPFGLARAAGSAADSKPDSTAKEVQRSSPAASKTESAPAMITPEQFKALQDALAAQERRIQQLEQQLQQRDQAWQQLQSELQRREATTTAVDTKVSEIQSSSNRQEESYKRLESDIADVRDNVTALAANVKEEQERVSWLQSLVGRARLFGDIRVENLSFFLAGQKPRVRERIRIHMGIEGQLGRDFIAGIGLATGTLADSTSGNAVMTNFFARKTVALHLAYITYNPQNHKWLNLTAGKFAFNWQQTAHTFDGDISPDGFSEKLSFDLNNKYLKNVTLHGLQLIFFENPNVEVGTFGGDSFAAGGQVVLKLQPHERWTITPSYLVLNWRNEGILLNAPAFAGAEAVSGTTSIVCNPVTALNTNPSCAFASRPYLHMTNAYKVISVADNGNVERALLSKFLYSDLILKNTIDTGLKRWPWQVTLEYMDNLRAASNRSHVYMVQTSFGQTRNQNDFLVGYGFVRQEQDSAIASFVDDDQRQPTNIVEHSFFAQYRLRPKVLLAWKLRVGRVLDSSLFAPVPIPGSTNTDALQLRYLAPGVAPGQRDHYRKRMQFDLIYTF